MTTRSSSRWPLRIAAGVAVAFGLLTIISGGRVLFGGNAAHCFTQSLISITRNIAPSRNF
ncbi:MAG TPA: hypothetical protein GX700_04820 [Paracoccus sp.]|nr:hypothetical protein [Paracoccus sp. (in: a-proteobacteria)]